MSRPIQTGTKATGPSFCWYCNRMLRRAPGKGLGLFFFAVVTDKQGNPHRVHGQCGDRTQREVRP